MIEVLKAYLQVANGVGDLTRQRALEAARQALAAAAVLPVASAGVDGLAAQASALADELLAAGRANREMLSHLVRAEVETVVSRLGLDGRSDLEAELVTSRARVRELEREHRIVSFRLAIPDRPGVLGQIATLIGELGANILEVSHGRLFLDVPAKGVMLDVTIETRDEAHTAAIEEALRQEGFAPRRIYPRGLAEPAG